MPAAGYSGDQVSVQVESWWPEVYIDLEGNSSFRDLDPAHGDIGCRDCHGGVEPGDATAAHDTSQGFLRDPSTDPEAHCTPCHETKVAAYLNSFHFQTWGIQTALAQRQLGADKTHENFAECPAPLTDGYDRECSTCHATCGQCHLSRPTVAGGGLLNSHRFDRPDPENTCQVCHEERITRELTGALDGNEADVHHQQGMDCLDCHTEDFHADASSANSFYAWAGLPQCVDCHTDADSANVYHETHWPDGSSYPRSLDCQVCHAQPYTSCSGCHASGEWVTDPAYSVVDTTLKIGLNPDPGLRPMVKWTLLRHIPVTPETFAPWGLSTLDQFDSRPTWNHTSPHTIRRWTARTDTTGGGACSDRCHYHANFSFADPVNRDLYLTRTFLQENYGAEETANDSVVVENAICGATCHERF